MTGAGSVMTLGALESEPRQENYSLWNAKNWLKAVTRGDSILFVYRQQVSIFPLEEVGLVVCL